MVVETKMSKEKEVRFGNTWISSVFQPMFKVLDIIWGVLPGYAGTLIGTVLLFLAGSMLRGEWLFILVHFIKYFQVNAGSNISHKVEIENVTKTESSPFSLSLKDMYLENVSSFIFWDLVIAYAMYFIVCGYLQWYFYIRQKDKSDQWKCQPNKFLSPEQERHEIVLGSLNVGFGGLFFGAVACYIYNGGPTAIYFKPDEYGWAYLILSIPIHFMYQDACAYYVHRLLHSRLVYANIHKWHHYYKQPTAFSTTAMHPAEVMMFQFPMLLITFFVPINAMVYIATMMYIYYYGLITHSGIHLEALWPWQNNVSYHDNHHQYFHVNFGSNTRFFDWLHGTDRRKDRVYNEKIFGGKGIKVKEANAELRKEHAMELAAEFKAKAN
ncbi:hypothetical protein CHUAL_001199 [Chamberlinius hualienensis]